MITALLTSAGVFAVLLVQGFLSTALSGTAAFGAFGVGFGQSAGQLWGSLLQDSLLTSLPFAVGVFLMLWQVAPIGPELRFAHVVTRALLAAAGGVVVVAFVAVIASLITAVAHLPAVFVGPVFGDLQGAFQNFGLQVEQGVLAGFRTFILEVPLVVLGGLLLWGWQQRHPEDHDVAGALDEV
jgi:hypothetical protein